MGTKLLLLDSLLQESCTSGLSKAFFQG